MNRPWSEALVRHLIWLPLVLLALVPPPPLWAHPLRGRFALDRLNAKIQGRVLDYTRNHGADRRLWSAALQQKRDLYVYLPPGYDPHKAYPLIIWLHGFAQDELTFLTDGIIPLDNAISSGQVPPVIIASPDGSVSGRDCWLSPGSFFINSEAGAFEDYLMVDVWDFLFANFPLRPEAGAHAIVGVSMGGGAAFNKAIKYPERFHNVLALFPPLNLRWMDCHGNYLANFDPNCWCWRTDFVHRHVVIGTFAGVIHFYLGDLLNPLYSRRNPDTLDAVIRENPVEMLAAYNVQPGQIAMYVAYGGRDQFNLDAQIESFLFVARQRGLEVGVGYDRNGHHDRPTAARLMPGITEWLGKQLWPFAPEGCQPGPGHPGIAPPLGP
jgi:S-formylglutathione hydrolase FrmB